MSTSGAPKDSTMTVGGIFPPGHTLGSALATAVLGYFGVAPMTTKGSSSKSNTNSLLLMVSGLLGMGLSIATVVVSVRTFAHHKTPVPHGHKVQTIVSQGIFRFSRNPIYLGMVGFVGSVGMVCNTWCGLLFGAYLFGLLDRLVIPKEEAYLQDNFKEYKAYQEKTPRWLFFY